MGNGVMSRSGDALYYVLLLVLPVSALMARRLPVGQTVKMAAAWTAIFGILFLIVALWQTATEAGGIFGSLLH
jgi:hypothetical protein